MTDATKHTETNEKLSQEDDADMLDRYQFSTGEITQGKLVKGRSSED
jgi:hypothetical protein